MLRSLRNFMITFVISALLFTIIAYTGSAILVECMGPMFGITSLQNGDSDKGDNNSDGSVGSGNTENATDTFSMLVINTNYKPSEASTFNAYDVARFPHNEKNVSLTVDSIGSKKIEATDFIIIRGNSQRNEYTYTYLPPSLTVTVKGMDMTLNDIYRNLGVTFLTQKISAITGFKFDFYSVYDLEDISYIIEYVGGVQYNVPVDIKIDEEVILHSGAKTISGAEGMILLDYNGYSNANQRNQMTVALLKAIMSKITNKIYKIDILALQRSSASKVDTTVTISYINSLLDLLYSYNTANVLEVTYPGSYKTNNGVTIFVPNISSAINKFSSYR